jgi:hypothetical protein
MGVARDIATLQAALKAAGTPHRMEWYPAHSMALCFRSAGIYDRTVGRAALGAAVQPV